MASLRPASITALDPELATILQKGPLFDPTLKYTVSQARHSFANTNRTSSPPSNITEIDHQISTRDGTSITIRTYTPLPLPSNPMPLLVLYHGGGFIIGDLTSEAPLARLFAGTFAGVAVNVAYRLAPEHPFPGPVNDCFDALKWVAAHAADLGADPGAGFIVGGVSAGATCAAVVAHLWRQEGGPRLSGLYLSCPATLYPGGVPEGLKQEYLSREELSDDPVASPWFRELSNKSHNPDHTSPLASPFLFTDHSGLPRTYLQICGRDALLDEELLFAKALVEAGTVVKTDFYAGVPHIFWTYFGAIALGKRWAREREEGMRWLLGGGAHGERSKV